MLKHALALLLLTLAPAHADVTIIDDEAAEIEAAITERRERAIEFGPWCQTSTRRFIYDYDTAPMRATLPTVVANAFDDDATSADLSFFVRIPTRLVPGCPDGSVEFVRNIRLLPDGSFEGVVQTTSMSFNGHLFSAEIAFTADDIRDWEFLIPGTATTPPALHGAFRLRNLPPRSDTPPPRYAPEILPPDWN